MREKGGLHDKKVRKSPLTPSLMANKPNRDTNAMRTMVPSGALTGNEQGGESQERLEMNFESNNDYKLRMEKPPMVPRPGSK